MTRHDFPGQAAAQRAYDNASPYDDADEARQDAIRETIAAANYGDPEQDGYGTDDAQGDYAQKLIEAGEVGEVVAELYDAAALLGWIARNVDLPANYLPAFRALIRRSESTFWAVDKLEAAA